LRWVSVCSVLDLTIVEIFVVTDGIDISVLLIAVGSVIDLLEGLDSECEVVQEDIAGLRIGVKFGAFDGSSRQNVHGAADLLFILLC